MAHIKRRGEKIEKPIIILDHNKCKAFVDISYQLKAYSTSLHIGIEWYRKLAVKLLSATTTIVTKKNMSITKFKELVVTQLLEESVEGPPQPNQTNPNHVLVDVMLGLL